jgi:hypothetical protein
MPELMKEALEGYLIAREAIAGSSTGMGGLNIEGLHRVLVSHGFVPGTGDYEILFRRGYHYLVNYMVASQKERKEKRKSVIGGGGKRRPPRGRSIPSRR